MGYRKEKSATELWAVMTPNGQVKWSRGGSSTTPKLMVYARESSAIKAMSSKWIDSRGCYVQKIWEWTVP